MRLNRTTTVGECPLSRPSTSIAQKPRQRGVNAHVRRADARRPGPRRSDPGERGGRARRFHARRLPAQGRPRCRSRSRWQRSWGLRTGTSASAGVAKSDVAILNFALTLEYLEAAFYTEAVASRALTGDLAKFAGIVKAHEVAHVAFLKGALGAKAVKKPKFDFKGTTTDEAKFKATAQVLEDTGVAAYLGQVGNIKSKKILGAAGSILPIEARHAGWIRDINGVSGAPAAFEAGKTKGQILAAVKGTGFIVG